MTTETAEISRKKEMTPTAMYLNISVQLILLIIAAVIITRTVNSVGIVLFTWHPVLVSIGVRQRWQQIYDPRANLLLSLPVFDSDVSRNSQHGRQQLHHAESQLSKSCHRSLGFADIRTHLNYCCSNLHLSQQEQTRKRPLSVDPLAFRTVNLFTDCFRFSWRNFH